MNSTTNKCFLTSGLVIAEVAINKQKVISQALRFWWGKSCHKKVHLEMGSFLQAIHAMY